MRYFLKIKYFSLVLLLLANTFLTSFVPIKALENKPIKLIPSGLRPLTDNTKLSYINGSEVKDEVNLRPVPSSSLNPIPKLSPTSSPSVNLRVLPSATLSQSPLSKPSLMSSPSLNLRVLSSATPSQSPLPKISPSLSPVVNLRALPSATPVQSPLPKPSQSPGVKESVNLRALPSLTPLPESSPKNSSSPSPISSPAKSATPYKEDLNSEQSEDEDEEEVAPTPKQEIDETPPNVTINDKQVIFKRVPVFDGLLWLFPLEEIATQIQDEVKVDLSLKEITIVRFRDRSVIKLDVNNGLVTINNNPFKVLAGFDHIILGSEVQLVPASAIAILHGLSLQNDQDKDYIFRSIVSPLAKEQTTVQPKARKGISNTSLDYLNTTTSVNDFRTAKLLSRRLQINSGGHNDLYALTSNLVFRGGTGGPFALFDTGNISYFKTDSPTQFTIGDKTLGNLKSPFLAGVILRGYSGERSGGLKDSKIIYGTGFIPSNVRIQGKSEAFLKYGRAAQVFEWISSPKKQWQFSLGEAVFKDTINNAVLQAKQAGGLVAATATKTGKYLEAQSNLSFGFANDRRYVPDKITDPNAKPTSSLVKSNKNGLAADTLIRLKPKEWFSIFGKGGYYGPKYYSLNSSTYYTDRNELSGGFNFGFQKLSFGGSGTIGHLQLDAKKPDTYKIISGFSNFTPYKKGPTYSLSYNKNLSKVNPDLAFINIFDPITKANKNIRNLDDILVRRTTSVFRAGLIQNWNMTNLNVSYNQIGLDKNSSFTSPQLGNDFTTSFKSLDFNTNRTVNKKLSLINFTQFSDRYKQARLGVRVGPIFKNKLSFQTQIGYFVPKKGDSFPSYNLNLNYDFSKKGSFSLNYDKNKFLSQIFLLMRYNFVGDQQSGVPSVEQILKNGKIRGRVVILDESKPTAPAVGGMAAAQGITLAKGLPKVRIYFGNHTIITDKDGYYEIDGVSPGIHKVSIDFSDIPAYLAAISNESVDVNVERGKVSDYDFILSYYGSAEGKLELIGENLDITKNKEEVSIEGIRIYLEGTDFEGLTNEDGTFVIGDVKPGKYKILVDPDFLPEYLEVVNEPQEIQIRSKQKVENLKLRIKYKERAIQQTEF